MIISWSPGMLSVAELLEVALTDPAGNWDKAKLISVFCKQKTRLRFKELRRAAAVWTGPAGRSGKPREILPCP